MKSAHFSSAIDPSFNTGTMIITLFHLLTDIVYCYDESTEDRIARFPLRRDPYESQYSYTKVSTLEGAGEGLFALRDLPAGFICCLYNGPFVLSHIHLSRSSNCIRRG